MKLYVFDDEEGKGKQLVSAARMRKQWEAHAFSKPSEIPKEPGYVFIWPAANPPNVERDKAMYRQILHLRPELKRIQSVTAMAVHGDKVAQAARWSPRWMPKTFVVMSAARAHDALHALKVPFISKSSHGSGGENVRAILTEQNALLEIAQVFGTKEGLPTAIRQRDYLLWQQLIPENPFTYRAIRVGNYIALLRRYRVSALNFNVEYLEPVNELDGEANDVIYKATRFLEEIRAPWCSVDIVFGDVDTYVLGTSMNWDTGAADECKFHGRRNHYHGRDLWYLLLDQLEEGVFDVDAT